MNLGEQKGDTRDPSSGGLKREEISARAAMAAVDLLMRG